MEQLTKKYTLPILTFKYARSNWGAGSRKPGAGRRGFTKEKNLPFTIPTFIQKI